MINVSISESWVSLDRYLSCYTSVEQMAIQIIHSTDVSFQRPGKFNLTVHVNEKFPELEVSKAGCRLRRLLCSVRGKGRQCRNSTLSQESMAAAAGIPGRQSLGKDVEERGS